MVKPDLKDVDLSSENIDTLNYKDTKILSSFISDQGKILPRRLTGLNSLT